MLCCSMLEQQKEVRCIEVPKLYSPMGFINCEAEEMRQCFSIPEQQKVVHCIERIVD